MTRTPNFYDLQAAARRYPAERATERLLLLALITYMGKHDDTWCAYPGVPALAEDGMCSVVTVRRYLAKWEDQGLITRRARTRQGTGAGRGRDVSEFVLNVDVLLGTNSSPRVVGPGPSARGETDQVRVGGGPSDHSGISHLSLEHKEQLTTEPPAPVGAVREEVSALADLLADLIAENGSKRPDPTRPTFTEPLRRMIDIDGHTVTQVANAIRWCQADDFWRANILSARALRAKYDSLRLAAQRGRKAGLPRTGPLSMAASMGVSQERLLAAITRPTEQPALEA